MAANLLSFDFIRGRLSAEQLGDLAVSLGLCLVRSGQDVVCSQCRVVWGLENTTDYVPFPEDDTVDGDASFEGH